MQLTSRRSFLISLAASGAFMAACGPSAPAAAPTTAAAVMTSGGPGWATMVPALRMYQITTGEYRYGYASAIGVVLFVLILGVTLLNQRYLRSSVEYEAKC